MHKGIRGVGKGEERVQPVPAPANSSIFLRNMGGTPETIYGDSEGCAGDVDQYVQSQPLLLAGSLGSSSFKCNTRKLGLLPCYSARAGIWELWVGLMTDLDFIASKCAVEGGVQEILQDYAMKTNLPEGLEVGTSGKVVAQITK